MKISINSVRKMVEEYKCAHDIIPADIDALVEKIGSQLGAVEQITRIDDKYKGIVIAKVISCEDHADADRLRVCRIDDGGVAKDVERDAEGYVQVVCGAPNVRTGLLVAWLPPGCTVPASYDTEPFVLEARNIRGQKSNGMIASLKELAIGDNHEGIAEIDIDVKPGTSFGAAYGLEDDVIIDIENKMFTHRPDCFGVLGVAREFAGIQYKAFSSPPWYSSAATIPAAKEITLPLEVLNEVPELVPRFMAVSMAHVKVGPSPLWLQVELAKIGQRPINNIVDYTNYFMLLTGQPLHAYDYDKVKALDPDATHATLMARSPVTGEKLTLLNGKEITPRPEAILITTATMPIGLAGVMGGAITEVDASTTNIILECATFDMYSIRRTSMFHGLFTDAVTRFNKGQSPLQNKAVLARIVDEITQNAGGEVASKVIDDIHLSDEVLAHNSLHAPIAIPASFVIARLGRTMDVESMARLLRHVEFGAETQEDHLMVKAPFWRTDIEIPEDIVEEIGRLYGFDKLPLELPIRSITPVTKDPLLELKATARGLLARFGANEVLTYSFVHGNLMEKVGQDKKVAYQLSNALSPDLQYYRLSLTPSLLDKVHANIKAGYDQFALFEIGKAHSIGLESTVKHDVPGEWERLACVFTANDKAAKQYQGAVYYQAKAYVSALIKELGITDKVTFVPLIPKNYIGVVASKIPYYEVGRAASIILGDLNIGDIGEYKASVRSSLKLPAFTAGFELDIAAILTHISHQRTYKPVSKYPSVTQDITLKVPISISHNQLTDFITAEITKARLHKTTFTLLPVSIYQKPDDQDHKQVTLHLKIASHEKTLSDTEVNVILETVAAAAHGKLNTDRV
jgi:phenylalanyl-tRNA synthetase beta chain